MKLSAGVFISFIAVLGNGKAKFPSDYCGWFSALAFTFRLWFFNGIVSGAISSGGGVTIGSIGFGVGISTPSNPFSFSQTYYLQLSGDDRSANNKKAKDSLYKETKWLLLIAAWFL